MPSVNLTEHVPLIGIGAAFDIHARRLYVGGIPHGGNDQNVIRFLSETLRRAGGISE